MKIDLPKYYQISQTLLGLIFFLLLIGCNTNDKHFTKVDLVKVDSVSVWLQQSKNETLSIKNRQSFLIKAYTYNTNQKIDFIKNENLLKIAFQAYKLKDSVFFKSLNQEAQEFSIKIRDTLGIAETHWNYASFYKNKEMMDKAFYHYYEAFKSYEAVRHEYYSAKMLYNMAFIQGRVKDYTGSEISIFKAIPKFEKLHKNLNLYKSYNYLGLIYLDLQEYNKAITYHNKSLSYLKKIKNKKTYKEGTLNDLGLVYQKQGNYKTAIIYFKQALANKNLKTVNIQHYARLIDNLAYTQFLSGDTINVLQNFNKTLFIKDSIHYISGKIISKLHLAEFYAMRTDTLTAVLNANEARILAKEINNNRDLLASLLLLSKIDKPNTGKYLKEYLSLNDSLQTQERKLREKSTRIRFETDVYIEKTETLSQQKIILISLGIIAILLFFLRFFIKRQHAKNKELEFEKEQQKANEEIYKLLIKQQTKLEEGRMSERHRISEDLHDGVLSGLCGTRLGLGFLKIEADEETLKEHKHFVDELQVIEKEIRDISHELKNELFSSQLNFITIVDDFIKSQSKITKFECLISSDPSINWNDVNENIKVNCYRLIQEAIQNINKYAKATLVNIDFNISDGKLKLMIKDNGIGFNINKKKNGIGLKNMKSRTAKMNGKFTLKSDIGKGTILTFLIPF